MPHPCTGQHGKNWTHEIRQSQTCRKLRVSHLILSTRQPYLGIVRRQGKCLTQLLECALPHVCSGKVSVEAGDVKRECMLMCMGFQHHARDLETVTRRNRPRERLRAHGHFLGSCSWPKRTYGVTRGNVGLALEHTGL